MKRLAVWCLVMVVLACIALGVFVARMILMVDEQNRITILNRLNDAARRA
jgi:hypothetical protein